MSAGFRTQEAKELAARSSYRRREKARGQGPIATSKIEVPTNRPYRTGPDFE